MTQQSHKKSVKKKSSSRTSENIYINKTIIVLLFFVLIILSLTAISSLQKKVESIPNARRVSVGETAESAENTFTAKVNSVSDDKKLAKRFRLLSDQRVLIYNISIKNTSDKNLQFLPALHTYLRDNEGDYYQILADVVDDPIKPTELQPGQTISGNLAFVTMNRKLPLYFYLDTGWEDRGPIVFDIVL